MTGRVCTVHGEWTATGLCRWCETGPRVVEVGRVTVTPAEPLPEGLQRTMDAAWLRLNTFGSATMFFPDERDAPYIDAETHAAEQSRLAAQHAALRWERVARRWAAKHRPWTMRDAVNEWSARALANYLKRLEEDFFPRLPVSDPKEPPP